MRRVVSTAEVFHLWANEAQPDAHNAGCSASFTDDLAYSYQTPIGRIVRNASGQKAFLITSTSYSMTTSSKHQPALQRAVFGRNERTFRVQYVAPGGRNSRDARHYTHDGRLGHMATEIANMLEKAKRSRKYAAQHLTRAADLIDQYNEYAKFFGLPERFSVEQGQALAAQLVEARKIEAIAARKEEEKRRVEMAERAEKWRNGEILVMSGYPDVLLRVASSRNDGDDSPEVETSKGARVPLHHAKRLFRAWMRGEAKQGDRVGQYTVNDANGVLHIGCHTITREEAVRFADSQGWER